MGHYGDLYEADENAAAEARAARLNIIIARAIDLVRDVKQLPKSHEISVAITQLETGLLWLKASG